MEVDGADFPLRKQAIRTRTLNMSIVGVVICSTDARGRPEPFMYLTNFPDESAAIRICHSDTVMFFLRSIVDQLVVLSNGNFSVEIIDTILSQETDEREDMDIEERMRADGRVNLDKPIQTPSPIFYALCNI
ncbi:hypothetical protein BLNAU_24495 [Blattamonas nauphoetae]|uniref:Uncharacterized protein n=1 Tax=Blattamonas nauphoetae TaxID=2049346 RepID=A0ABQ9WPC9_9EUKA|nr:hypothetical protein BLNAU_24495 [Blattamonas nauphoetae]